MKRVLFAALLCAGLFGLLHRPAMAVTEFCPANLEVGPVGEETVPAQMFALQLFAFSKRSVTATVVFDTSAGWFQVDLPQVLLSGSVPWRNTTSTASPILYVSFPSALEVHHALISNAASQGDGFGWEQRGRVACPPTVYVYKATPKRLFDEPNKSAIVVTAKPRSPLVGASCEEPFKDATVTEQAEPSYPDAVRQAYGTGTAAVEVALNGDGSIADTWITQSTGWPALDASAVDAATHSKYRGQRSYCQNVPSLYVFKVTYTIP